MNLNNLEIRLAFLREQMDNIKESGEVAPAGTWIHKYVVPKKNGKKYYYYRLMEATNKKSKTGSIQGKVKLYLGNAKSSLYKRLREAINRRNQLKALQRRYDKLMALYQAALEKSVSTGNLKSEVTKGYCTAGSRQGLLHRRQSEVIEPSTVSLVDVIPKLEEIAKIQESQEKIWHWLKVIGSRLGIAINEPVSATG